MLNWFSNSEVGVVTKINSNSVSFRLKPLKSEHECLSKFSGKLGYMLNSKNKQKMLQENKLNLKIENIDYMHTLTRII